MRVGYESAKFGAGGSSVQQSEDLLGLLAARTSACEVHIELLRCRKYSDLKERTKTEKLVGLRHFVSVFSETESCYVGFDLI